VLALARRIASRERRFVEGLEDALRVARR
jgi:hypothetical protein